MILSKFKFITSLVACSFTCILFQVSHFKLMFYVFYRNTLPFASPFVPFYAQNDFFHSPLSRKSLFEFVEGITRQMAAYSMLPSSSNKRKYGSLLLKFVNDETIESLD